MEDHLHHGRGSVPSIDIEGFPGEKMVIRKYLRGGFLRFFNRDVYLGKHRPFKELFLAVQALSRGIPTSDLLAAVNIKVYGRLYRGYLVSKELSSCCDLPSYLTSLAQNKEGGFLQEKRKIIKRIAGLIRLMHDKGFYHGDLNLKNILIDKINPQNIYIIDWDKSRLKPSLNMSDRRANMLRFCRSMTKFKGYGFPLTERDQLFFLKNYWQGNKKIQSEIRKLLLRLRFSLAIRSPVWKLSKNK